MVEKTTCESWNMECFNVLDESWETYRLRGSQPSWSCSPAFVTTLPIPWSLPHLPSTLSRYTTGMKHLVLELPHEKHIFLDFPFFGWVIESHQGTLGQFSSDIGWCDGGHCYAAPPADLFGWIWLGWSQQLHAILSPRLISTLRSQLCSFYLGHMRVGNDEPSISFGDCSASLHG